ncbi:MAG: 2Fe-2S iron-sulfur cluster-binding protein, partial [Phycisphaerae bacterium]
MSTATNHILTQPAATQAIALTLNDRPVRVNVDPERSLLDVLREDLDIISPKDGCQPQAQCGCCTVLIDGQPRLSCVTKIGKIAGRKVTTAEGLSCETRQQVADCFVRAGGVQCGFCIPGFAIRAVSLLEKNAAPTREEIATGLRAHLCRCTGYTKIVDAIQMLARVRGGEALPDADTSGRVGTRLPRYRGHEFVLGDFKYIDDIKVDGSLYAAMRFSDHPRALVRSIDPAPAMAMPGVHRVITAADVPGDRYVGLIVRDWPILVAIDEETRCVGDILAIVVAEDQRTAREAAGRIEIDYEIREPITSPEDGLKPDAPKIHPGGNL